jgi:hypothetical protein
MLRSTGEFVTMLKAWSQRGKRLPAARLLQQPRWATRGERTEVTANGVRSVAGLVQKLGARFSRELGINVTAGQSVEIFKWFLASVLFGARISETIAVRTYREFEKQRLLSPKSIVSRGWDGLVKVLDRGGYVRYDFKTATKLLEVCRTLRKSYGGDLNALHATATNMADLEERLTALGKGIGDVTVNIFLRELRGVWSRAEPLPSDLVVEAAKDLGLLLPKACKERRRALALLKERWTVEGNSPQDFVDFEAALLRWGLALRRQARRKRRDQKEAASAVIVHRRHTVYHLMASHRVRLPYRDMPRSDTRYESWRRSMTRSSRSLTTSSRQLVKNSLQPAAAPCGSSAIWVTRLLFTQTAWLVPWSVSSSHIMRSPVRRSWSLRIRTRRA